MTAQRNKIDLDALREITDLILSRATPPRRVRGEHQEQKVDDCLLVTVRKQRSGLVEIQDIDVGAII